MSKIRTKPYLATLILLPVCSGCFIEELELFLNADGSGRIVHSITFSERFVVAMRDNDASSDPRTLPMSEEKIRERIGDALDITRLEVRPLPDGEIHVHLEGTFDDPATFFSSSYARDTCHLRWSRPSSSQLQLNCELAPRETVRMFSMNKVYGAAKGMVRTWTIHFPADIERTNGTRLADKPHSVQWQLDLRNQEGLEQSTAFVEGPDGGIGTARVSASALDFTYPFPARTAEVQKDQTISGDIAESDASAYRVALDEISWTKTRSISEEDGSESDLCRLTFLLHWPEDADPVSYYEPVISSVFDDDGHDLTPERAETPRIHSVHGTSPRRIRADVRPPGSDATELVNLAGHLRVVADVRTETVALTGLHELAGQESTGNAELDQRGVAVDSAEGNVLILKVRDREKTLHAMELLDGSGQEIPSSSGQGFGDRWQRTYRRPIPEDATLKLTLVTEMIEVDVPFEVERVKLP